MTKIRNRSNFDPKSTENVETHKIRVVREDKEGKAIVRMEKPTPKFKDGQILDNHTLVKRMLNGSISDKIVEGSYYGGTHESQDIEELQRMDIQQQLEVVEENAEYLKETEETLKSHIETKKEEAERLEAEKAEQQKVDFEKAVQAKIDKDKKQK